ncbi:MAG: ATP-binding cassette domain-containing protein [Deltaproteobacteria bacterium]|jgi:phospholipid/cholesterol/gamma-HCH transport system ATP-binding protein|nr:ATP-binding cassette domain-containing protein [Deltaproteobacteria bacterium]
MSWTGDPPDGAWPLEVEDLTVAYPGGPALLERVALRAAPGEILGLLGPSGCGKSTLLRHLVGLERPRRGRIALFGRDLWADEGAQMDLLRRRFGMMYQGGALFGDLTLLENVVFPLREFTDLPLKAAEAAARLKLSLVGLAGFEHSQPASLSGGMRKRAAIARALALEPKLLFLDEPSAGLDPVTSAGLDQLIVTLARNLSLAFVMVTHELGSIMTAVDRAVLFDRELRGVAAEGSPAFLASELAGPQAAAFFRRAKLDRGAQSRLKAENGHF